jgi:hypothetical protein
MAPVRRVFREAQGGASGRAKEGGVITQASSGPRITRWRAFGVRAARSVTPRDVLADAGMCSASGMGSAGDSVNGPTETPYGFNSRGPREGR